MPLTTTYRHDYGHPNAFSVKLHKDSSVGGQPNDDCLWCKENTKTSESIVPIKHDFKQNVSTEWTDIAPMVVVINPQIIPSNHANQPLVDSCAKCNQNKSPDFYAKIKVMPHDDCKKYIFADNYKTTYQADYGHPSMNGKNAQTTKSLPSCDDPVLDILNKQRAAKLGKFRPISRAKNVCYKHCCIKKKEIKEDQPEGRRISEYMDNTSRIGSLIVKYKILNQKLSQKSYRSVKLDFYEDPIKAY